MMVGEQEFTEKASKLRALKEAEKIALICGQQYKLDQLKDKVEELKCAHESGQCVHCKDKDQTIEDLNDTVKALRAKLYGKSSERRSRGKKPGDRHPKKSPSPTRTRLPSEQYPDAKVEVRTVVDSEPPKCPECEENMTDSGLRETSERLELIPMEIYIVRMNRVRYHCKGCQTAPQTAALPARIAPTSSLSDSVLIEASMAKFYDLIPTERFAKMLARSSVDISDKLLLAAQNYLAEAFYPIYLALKKEVQTSRVVHADETPHRMLERNEGHQWYLWCFCTKSAVYFEIHSTRAGSVSIDFLKESLAAVLMSDVYSGYIRTIREVNEYRQSINIPLMIPAHCNDHSRRYFINAQEHILAEQVLDHYGKIYTIESEVQSLVRSPIYHEPENSEKALELRQTMDPLFEQIHDMSAEILMDNPSTSSVGKAANYFLNNVTGLTVFLKDLSIPISNAPAERSIRNPVIGRKTWLGTHSKRGAETSAIHLSIFESCRLNEVNPREYCNYNAELYCQGKPLLTPLQYKQFIQSKPLPS